MRLVWQLRLPLVVVSAVGLVFATSALAAPTATQIKDINPGSGGSLPRVLTDVGGTLLFAAKDDARGVELWKSDGTDASTTLVEDINPGSAGSYPGSVNSAGPLQSVNVAGTFFFSADDGTHGFELWRSGGTAPGTELVEDLNPGSAGSFPRSSPTSGAPSSLVPSTMLTDRSSGGPTARPPGRAWSRTSTPV